MKRRNRERAIFDSNFKVPRDPKRGCAETFDSFVEASKTAPGVVGGLTNVSSSSDASVDLLWVEVKPINITASKKMIALLNRFAIVPTDCSFSCCHFDTVTFLLEVNLSVLHDVDMEDDDEENTGKDTNSKSGGSDAVNM